MGRASTSTTAAASLMVVSTLMSSLVPLVIDVSVGADRSPFTVGFGVITGFVVLSFLIRGLLPTRGHLALTLVGLWHRCASSEVAASAVVAPLAAAAVGGFGYIVFAWSSAHVDTAVTSSVFQLWACLWFFVMGGVDAHRVGRRLQTVAPSLVYALGAAALGGAVLAALSAGGGGGGGGSAAVGVALAAGGAVIGASPAVHFLAVDRIIYGSGAGASDRWTASVLKRFSALEVEESVSLTLVAGSALVASAVSLVLAVNASGWTAVMSWPLVGGLTAGALLNSPASYLLRRAMFVFPRREIIAIYCLEPGLAVLWLWLWRGLNVGRPGLLVAGVAVVTVANLLIHTTRLTPANEMAGQADLSKLSKHNP